MKTKTPTPGIQGYAENWRNDIVSALSVALVALPLGLGIAIACGFPPMSGITVAIIGGLVTTFFRSSQLAINGPSAGSIAVLISAGGILEDGTNNTINYILAAVIISGALQVLFGVLKLGRFAEQLPSSVINGILASIGIIIITKQSSFVLGIEPIGENTIDQIVYVLSNLDKTNPILLFITLIGLALMSFHNKISHRLFNLLPTPIWVLLISIPFVYLFDFFNPHSINLIGLEVYIGPEFLLNIPNNIWESFIYPDFSRIASLDFWTVVISINLITSVEHLIATKAVDKIDPYRRRTDIDKDLIGVGIGTIVSASIGGLPLLTAIVRSSVNIQNGAKTKGSNFFMGLILLLMILILAPYLQKIPLAALATILIFTGFRLASPNVFRDINEKGIEQVIFFLGTLFISLYKGMHWGIFGGILITLIVHVLIARMPITSFLYLMLTSSFKLINNDNNGLTLKATGIVNFLNILRLQKKLDSIKPGTNMIIDLSSARIVDLTVSEIIDNFKMSQAEKGGKVQIHGLDKHISVSGHKYSLRSLTNDQELLSNAREERLSKIAEEYNWTYQRETSWFNSYLRNFDFFKIRPIERKFNVISGIYEDQNAAWEICDVTFDEGALMAKEVFQTTAHIIILPYKIPRFILEKEGLFDKVFEKLYSFSGRKDIDFKEYPNFSKKFYLSGHDEESVRNFFNSRLIHYLDKNEIYHIESNGEALLIFRHFHQAKTEDIFKMLEFSKSLLKVFK